MIDEGDGLTKATFEGKTVKEQARLSAEIITDTENLNKILSGEKSVPNDISPVFLAKAIEDEALRTGNRELLEKLALSDLVKRSSLSAQDLRFARERNPDSITLRLREIKLAKEKALKTKLKKGVSVDKARSVAKKELKAKLEKSKPTKQDWKSFVKEIKC